MKEIIKKNKKGWIKILEAFIAILFVISILSVIISKESTRKDSSSDYIYQRETEILRGIELNDSWRGEIINLNLEDIGFLKIYPGDVMDGGFGDYMLAENPPGYFCLLKACTSEDPCQLNSEEGAPNKASIYVKEIIISSSLEKFEPRKLNIFCWKI